MDGAWGLLLAIECVPGDGVFSCDYTTYVCSHSLASFEEANNHIVNCLWLGVGEEPMARSCRWTLGAEGGLQPMPSKA